MKKNESIDIDFAIMDLDAALKDLQEVYQAYIKTPNPHSLVVNIFRFDQLQIKKKIDELKKSRPKK